MGRHWGDMWEKDDKTTEMPWMESVSEKLRQKITNIKEFNITKETLEKETKTRKNLNALGIDGIQIFWWKRLRLATKEMN